MYACSTKLNKKNAIISLDEFIPSNIRGLG